MLPSLAGTGSMSPSGTGAHGVAQINACPSMAQIKINVYCGQEGAEKECRKSGGQNLIRQNT